VFNFDERLRYKLAKETVFCLLANSSFNKTQLRSVFDGVSQTNQSAEESFVVDISRWIEESFTSYCFISDL